MIWMRDLLNARGLEGSHLETMLDKFLKISAQDYADVDHAEIMAKFGHEAGWLVVVLGAIGRETR